MTCRRAGAASVWANPSSRWPRTSTICFAGSLTVALTPANTVSVEEAYGLVTGLGNGLAPKFGRFFSGIGYQNEQHQHAWDFDDAPLAYQAFLGGQYSTDGVQLKWLAPTDHFVELGAELGNGDSFPGQRAQPQRHRRRERLRARRRRRRHEPQLARGPFVSSTRGRRPRDDAVRRRRQSCTERIQRQKPASPSPDFVWKWAPNGNAQQTNFKLQGEYFWRREHGDLTFDTDGASG